jgi:hypothetical protein
VTSCAKVERARVVLSDPDEAAAVQRGEKTIHQAANAAKAKRDTQHSPVKKRPSSPDATQAEEEALAEGLRIIGLLQVLAQRDPNASRRKALRSVIKMLRAIYTRGKGNNKAVHVPISMVLLAMPGCICLYISYSSGIMIFRSMMQL